MLSNTSFVEAQGIFQKTFGTHEDKAIDIKGTSDGGSIITGLVHSSNDTNIFLLKLNMYGDTSWTGIYGTSADDVGTSVMQTSEGGYLIGGNSNTGVLLKVDSSGNLQWQKEYGAISTRECSKVIQSTDSSYMILGMSNYSTASLIKVDSNGDSLWTMNYIFNFPVKVGGIANGNNGGHILLLNTTFTINGSGILIIRTDDYGDTIWIKTYNETFTSTGTEILNIPTGGYLITGHSGETIFFIKINEAGTVIWSSKYYNFGSTFSEGMVLEANGDFAIVGTATLINNDDLILVKFDSNGNVKFAQLYGIDIFSERGDAIARCNDGGYFICGSKNWASAAGGYILKVDSLGQSGCDDSTTQMNILPIVFYEDSNITVTTTRGMPWSNAGLTMSRGISIQNICSTISVPEIQINQLDIFPNPTSDLIKINGTSSKGIINIYNSFGQLIYSKSAGENESFLPLKGGSGFYIIRYTIGDRIFINQIVKI